MGFATGTLAASRPGEARSAPEVPSMFSCPRVAYFCMEYGLDPSFPIYAGGLGILAGDHMKSVGDLHVPVTGIGLSLGRGVHPAGDLPRGTLEDQYPEDGRATRCAVSTRGSRSPSAARTCRAGVEGRAATSPRPCTCSSRSATTTAGSRSASTAAAPRTGSPRRSCSASAACACCAALGERARRLSLQRGPRGVRRARAAAPARGSAARTLRRSHRAAAAARGVHDPHAGPGGQRGPRPRR